MCENLVELHNVKTIFIYNGEMGHHVDDFTQVSLDPIFALILSLYTHVSSNQYSAITLVMSIIIVMSVINLKKLATAALNGYRNRGTQLSM